MRSFGGFAWLLIDKIASSFSSKNLRIFFFVSCCCDFGFLARDLNLAVFSMVIHSIPFCVQATASVAFYNIGSFQSC